MKSISACAVAAAMSLVLPVAAQEPRAEIPTTVGESIDVRVVNVEAVVTRASGERVRGLAAADFRLLVDGKEVPVEYFTEVADGTALAATPGSSQAPVAAGEEVARNFLVYVDDSFSLATRRNDVLDKLERDLALLGPADRMAILAFDGARVSVLCPWTAEAAALRAALAQARLRGFARRSPLLPRHSPQGTRRRRQGMQRSLACA